MILLGFWMHAQNFTLDNTFGTAGLSTTMPQLVPQSALFDNNHYLFLAHSGNTVARVNYDGSVDTSFGQSGFKILSNDQQTLTLAGMKLHAGYIYVFGKTTVAGNENSFLIKLDDTGANDTGFGIDGKITVDLGENEVVNDLLFNADGTFFALGTQTAPNFSKSFFVHKFLADGSPDSAFNSTGTKFFEINGNDSGSRILASGNDLLLAGLTKSDAIGDFGFLMKTDQDGNLVTSFGNAGLQTFNLLDPVGTINDVQVFNNEVFFSYFWGTSFVSQGQRLKKFDMASGQQQFALPMPSDYPYFRILPNGKILVTGANRCNMEPYCNRDYMIGRFLNNGETDLGFNTSGIFTFDLATLFGSMTNLDDASSAFYMHDDGKILLAGKTHQFGTVGYRFGMIRIVPAALGVDGFAPQDFAIYPNPASHILHVSNANSRSVEKTIISDLTGKIIQTQTGNRFTLDVSRLQPGIYILTITAAGTNTALKFVKS